MADPIPNYDQNYLYSKDIEARSDIFAIQLRLGFIRKVYGILSAQLLLTVLLCGLTFINPVRAFYQQNVTLFWICLALSLFMVCPLICCRSVARTTPINYVFLGVWTFCEGYMVATCCSFYSPEIVITAATLTCAITLALTVYACTTKTDFTFMGGMLYVGCVLLIFFGLFSFLFGSVLNTLYCVLGVFLFSLYLIYDTQLVMGKFGNEYEIDDYIIAALMIYIDIIQIFMYLLELFGKNNR
jgi:FtsH-binding integral membrane protein